jgi:hypothetical protein
VRAAAMDHAIPRPPPLQFVPTNYGSKSECSIPGPLILFQGSTVRLSTTPLGSILVLSIANLSILID